MENDRGAPGMSALRALFALAIASALLGCPSDGDGSRLPPVFVEPGEPELPPEPGHVGSEACGQCHGGIFSRWGRTSHNLSLRDPLTSGPAGLGVVADADDNGLDDFQDGLDFSTDPDFSIFGIEAPRLSYVDTDPLPYKIQVGPITYDVRWTYGGTGSWRQLYITKVGRSLYVLPVQYNEAGRDWVSFSPGDWYDPANLPLYTNLATLPTDILKEASFERRCSGCHHTGASLGYDGATGEWLSGYVELNTGCESCHGPGSGHVSTQDPADIVNPRSFADGTAPGLGKANEVCGGCHSKGLSVDAAPGAPLPYLFPWSLAGGILDPLDLGGGANLTDFLSLSVDPNDFWGHKDSPLGPAPTPADPSDDSFVAARSPYQQMREVGQGPHAPSLGTEPACFDCHDPHGSSREHMIRDAVQVTNLGGDRVSLVSSAGNNTLCLSCHGGSPPFATILPGDLRALAGGVIPFAVRASVTIHMRENGMLTSFDEYDPAGPLRIGNCVECHMPKLGISAAGSPDLAGYIQGDLRSHTFEAVWPSASEASTGGLRGMSNSCNGCHDPMAGPLGDLGGRIIWEWGRDRGGVPSLYHASTPLPSQTGVSNPLSASGGIRCVACHTGKGFVEIQVFGDASGLSANQARVDEIIRDSVENDAGITCSACHGLTALGEVRPDNLVVPRDQLCQMCHNAATVVFGDFEVNGEVPESPTLEILNGTGGARQPFVSYQQSAHSFVADCEDCHMAVHPANTHIDHGFGPTLVGCNVTGCHGAAPLGSFDRRGLDDDNDGSPDDYDGDGLAQGVQIEVTGLLALLEAQILISPNIWKSLDGKLFVDDDPLGPTYAGDDVAKRLSSPPITVEEKRAVFNHYTVSREGSRGVHNTGFAIGLLQQSFLEIGGIFPNAPVIRQ